MELPTVLVWVTSHVSAWGDSRCVRKTSNMVQGGGLPVIDLGLPKGSDQINDWDWQERGEGES